MMDAAAYTRQLQQLLPLGIAWTRAPGATLTKLLGACADGFARVHAAIVDLRVQADPRTTVYLLTEWEDIAGLPDPCVTKPQTLGERRRALVARVRGTGGASAAYFEGIARDLGYTARVVEVEAHVWRMEIFESTGVTLFRAGASRAGDRLREFGIEQLECVINRIKPAHTRVLFAYGVSDVSN